MGEEEPEKEEGVRAVGGKNWRERIPEGDGRRRFQEGRQSQTCGE